MIRSGEYYHEELFVADPSALWEGEFESTSGQPIDVYIIHTTDLLPGGYPDNNFSPLAESENITETAFAFRPPSRFTSYTLIVDNLDNSHPFDATPSFSVTVRMARSAPLRSNPQAEALLGSLTGICAAVLLVGAVAVAIYLRYRRPPAHEDESSLPPRIEIDVEVPRRPRGAWAASEPTEVAPTDRETAQEPPGGPP